MGVYSGVGFIVEWCLEWSGALDTSTPVAVPVRVDWGVVGFIMEFWVECGVYSRVAG